MYVYLYNAVKLISYIREDLVYIIQNRRPVVTHTEIGPIHNEV